MDTVNELKNSGIDTGMLHICNSFAILKYPEMYLDAVRAGSILVGRVAGACKDLRKIAFLETQIEEIRKIPEGTSVRIFWNRKSKKTNENGNCTSSDIQME